MPCSSTWLLLLQRNGRGLQYSEYIQAQILTKTRLHFREKTLLKGVDEALECNKDREKTKNMNIRHKKIIKCKPKKKSDHAKLAAMML